jgi:YaiO family outer membrane protein
MIPRRTARLAAVMLVLHLQPCAVAGDLEDGLAAKQAGRLEEAASLLRKATRQHPENAEAWFHLGTVLGWQGHHDESLTALRRGLSIAPADYDLRMAEAPVLAWQSDYASADSRLEALEKEFPGNEEVLVMRGRIASWRGDPQSARRIYTTVLEKNPKQVDALTGLGDLERDRNKIKQARALYVRALAQDPSPDIQKRIDGIDKLPKGRVDFGVTGSTFERGERDDWWSASLSVSGKIVGWDVWGRYEYGERFLLQDQTFELGASGEIFQGVRLTAFGGYTPDADYSANGYAEGALRSRLYERAGPLGSGWLLTEGRWADYEAGRVDILRLGWEQSLTNGWSLNARWLRLFYDTGEETDGWVAYFSWEPRERWMLRVGGGQSVESLTNQTLNPHRLLKSWTVFAGLTVPVSEQWHVRVDAEREDVKDSVVRYGLAVGLGCYF